jgi:tetratricopeptide (TPR) repeat protein
VSKFFLFVFLSWLTGNPILAVIVILAVYLAIDRRYYGLLPDPLRTFRSSGRIRELKRIIAINPHDARSLKELGVSMLERRNYQKALEYFSLAESKMSDDPEFNYYHGIALARNGFVDKGRTLVDGALLAAPGLKYGDPYLAMAEVYIDNGAYDTAVPFLDQFLKVRSSSVEGLYQMGFTKIKTGNADEGKAYLGKAVAAFRDSPRYKRKIERKWVWKARLLQIRQVMGQG